MGVIDDIIVNPIKIALEEAMDKYVSEPFCYEALRRCAKMWDSIDVHNVESVGLNFNEYCKQLEEKNNILFLSDKELKDMKRAMRIMYAIEGVDCDD